MDDAVHGLIVGLGSIGRRHLANLRALLPPAQLTVWRQHARPESAATTAAPADRVVFSLDDAVAGKPAFAFIASPAALHIPTALELARRGIHLFVEKPLSHSLEGVDELIDVCRRNHTLAMVGYNFRFHRPLELMRQALYDGRIGRPISMRAEVGQYLPDWRPDADYRQTATAQRRLGGGVLLELSHELDYARWLLGEVASVAAQAARLGDLEIDVEDTADVLLRFAGGATAAIHLDMLERAPRRCCRITGAEGTLDWDAAGGHVRLFSVRTGQWADLHPPGPLDRNAMYLAETAHFLDCVRRHEEPCVSLEEGRRTLCVALAAKQSAQTQRSVNP